MSVNPKPWERQPSETSRQFAAFCVYRDMGPNRSIEKAVIKGKVSQKAINAEISRWQRWAAQYHWVNRCLAWQDEQDRITRTAFMDEIRNHSAIQARSMVKLFGDGMVAMLKKDLSKEQVIPLLNIIQVSLQELRIAWGIQAEMLEINDLIKTNTIRVDEPKESVEGSQPKNVLQLKAGKTS